jgi:uncharacterized membrane protein YedE/YeeE
MHGFTALALRGVVGGALIGVGLGLLLLYSGRPIGVSGVVGGLIPPRDRSSWRLFFLMGLLAGGVLLALVAPGTLRFGLDRSPIALLLAGGLVGFGTRLGDGCTSGHAVCGIGRLSPRSITATAIFMLAGAASVYVVNHLLGARL